MEILSAFEGLNIECPSTLNIGESSEINVNVKQGTSPYISWSINHDGSSMRQGGKLDKLYCLMFI